MKLMNYVKITKRYITGKNRPGIKLKKKKKIVIHWAGNTNRTANALNTSKFFENVEETSAQYVVDDINIFEIMDPNEVAYAVGAKSYTAFGKSLIESGYTPNFFTISIEMCVNGDSDFNKVELNTLYLTVYLLLKTGLTPADVVRHYDITGKMCPDMYLTDPDWKEFLAKVKKIYDLAKVDNDIPAEFYVINDVMQVTANAIIRKGPRDTYDAVGSYAAGDKITVLELTDGFYKTGKGWVSAKLLKDIPENPIPSLELGFSATVTPTVLNIRSTPNVGNNNKVGEYKKGDVIILLEEQGQWYKTKDGYVHSDYVTRSDERRAYVLSSDHNVFDTDDCNKVIGFVPKNTNITIFGEYKINNKRVLAIGAPKGLKGFILG